MKRIVVLGAQRSGTNIAAKIIANDNNLPCYNERDIGYSSCSITPQDHQVLIDFMNEMEFFVLQAPSLNVFAHKLNDWLDIPVEFVWVNREANEVRKSRKRVNWSGEEKEATKYLENFPLISNDCKDSVEMAQLAWKLQQPYVDFTEIHYDSLKGHELWKDEREALGIGDT